MIWNDQKAKGPGWHLYTSHTIGFVHHFTDLIRIRPEVRYERAYADGG